MKKLLLFCILFNSFFSNSQSLKESLAQKYFNLLAYAKAINYYDELASDKSAKPINVRRAAECYKNLNNHSKASYYYEKLVSTNSATNSDLFNLTQSLKSIGNYELANNYIKLLQINTDYPIFTKRHSENINYYNVQKIDSSMFTISIAEFNSEESDFSPFVNLNKIYFTSNRRNVASVNKKFAWDDTYFLDQYEANYVNNKVTDVKPMSREIDSKYHEGPAILSPDGNTLYLTRSNFINNKLGTDKEKHVNLKIFISKRKKNGDWGKFENFIFNSDDYSIGHPALSVDGSAMYFVSDMPGGFGQTDLYVTYLDSGVWSLPKNLGPSINSEGREMFPSIYNGGELLFSSDGNAGLGGLDLYFAMPNTNGFFEPQNLKYPINTNFDDFGIFLNQDNKSGFISSNRDGGKGKDDICLFTSKFDVIPKYYVEGIVTDKTTDKPIKNASVDLFDKTGKVLNTVKTDSNGYYKLPLQFSNEYSLEGIKDEYVKDIVSIDTKDAGLKNLKANLKLDPSGVYAIVGIVENSKTKEPINNVAVLIKDRKTGDEVLKALTTNKGDFEKMLGKLHSGDLLDYEIQLQKEGYAIKTVIYTKTLARPEIIRIHELLDLTLLPIEGEKEFEINPIFFDLDKSNIRNDAKIELDKLVALLNSRESMVIEITSHTDCRASNSYNLSLSKRRAIATKNYLISRGVNENRLKYKFVGESELTTNCPCEPSNKSSCSEDEHQMNRRSNFKVINDGVKDILK